MSTKVRIPGTIIFNPNNGEFSYQSNMNNQIILLVTSLSNYEINNEEPNPNLDLKRIENLEIYFQSTNILGLIVVSTLTRKFDFVLYQVDINEDLFERITDMPSDDYDMTNGMVQFGIPDFDLSLIPQNVMNILETNRYIIGQHDVFLNFLNEKWINSEVEHIQLNNESFERLSRQNDESIERLHQQIDDLRRIMDNSKVKIPGKFIISDEGIIIYVEQLNDNNFLIYQRGSKLIAAILKTPSLLYGFIIYQINPHGKLEQLTIDPILGDNVTFIEFVHLELPNYPNLVTMPTIFLETAPISLLGGYKGIFRRFEEDVLQQRININLPLIIRGHEILYDIVWNVLDSELITLKMKEEYDNTLLDEYMSQKIYLDPLQGTTKIKIQCIFRFINPEPIFYSIRSFQNSYDLLGAINTFILSLIPANLNLQSLEERKRYFENEGEFMMFHGIYRDKLGSYLVIINR